MNCVVCGAEGTPRLIIRAMCARPRNVKVVLCGRHMQQLATIASTTLDATLDRWISEGKAQVVR